MKIGVSGASGHLGRGVVSELLQRPGGHEVVAITRTPETVFVPAQGRFGDYNRPESLAKAYAGLDRRSGTRKARSAERRCHRAAGAGGAQRSATERHGRRHISLGERKVEARLEGNDGA